MYMFPRNTYSKMTVQRFEKKHNQGKCSMTFSEHVWYHCFPYCIHALIFGSMKVKQPQEISITNGNLMKYGWICGQSWLSVEALVLFKTFLIVSLNLVTCLHLVTSPVIFEDPNHGIKCQRVGYYNGNCMTISLKYFLKLKYRLRLKLRLWDWSIKCHVRLC